MIAVVVATLGEYEAVGRGTRSLYERTVCIYSGVGKAYAAAAAMGAANMGAKAVLNVGLAGGMDPALAVGDVVAVRDAVSYDVDLSAVNGTEIGTLDGDDSPFIPLCVAEGRKKGAARIGTADRFADGERDAETLRRLGCALCDMECAAVAQICRSVSVPCFAFKVVSDVASRPSQPGQYAENAKACLERIVDGIAEWVAEVEEWLRGRANGGA